MNEELILQIRLLIGDIPASPFYPLLSDEEYERIITMFGTDAYACARIASYTAAFVLSGWPTRERTGDIEVYTNLSTSYLAVLKEFNKSSSNFIIPAGLLPWIDIGCPNPLSTIKQCEDDCPSVDIVLGYQQALAGGATLPSYTLASLPLDGSITGIILVSNSTPPNSLCYWDGVNWINTVTQAPVV
jgi:hypothetical protein